jgi:hypothetical protein
MTEEIVDLRLWARDESCVEECVEPAAEIVRTCVRKERFEVRALEYLVSTERLKKVEIAARDLVRRWLDPLEAR